MKHASLGSLVRVPLNPAPFVLLSGTCCSSLTSDATEEPKSKLKWGLVRHRGQTCISFRLYGVCPRGEKKGDGGRPRCPCTGSCVILILHLVMLRKDSSWFGLSDASFSAEKGGVPHNAPLLEARPGKKGPLLWSVYRHFNYCHQPIAHCQSPFFPLLSSVFFSPYLTTLACVYCLVTQR